MALHTTKTTQQERVSLPALSNTLWIAMDKEQNRQNGMQW